MLPKVSTIGLEVPPNPLFGGIARDFDSYLYATAFITLCL